MVFQTHKKAKEAFDKIGLTNIPKVAELNNDITKLCNVKHIRLFDNNSLIYNI